MRTAAKLFTVILLAALLFATLTACNKGGEEIRDEQKLENLFPKLTVSDDEIFLIRDSAMTRSEYLAVTSLQGIVAKTAAKIFIYNDNTLRYLDGVLASGIAARYFDDPWELVEACKDSLSDAGAILFDAGDNPTVNMAATVAGVERWLTVAKEDAAKIEECGLIVKRDLTEKDGQGEYVATQDSVFEEYKDRLYNGLILHQFPTNRNARDYSIALGAPCYFVSEDDWNGKKARDKVFDWAQDNAPLFGWTTDEVSFVARASKYGLYVIASDHSSNLSYLAGMYKNKPAAPHNPQVSLTANPNKHYVALVMSDGDNLQWFYNSFPFNESFYRERILAGAPFKMSWTLPPSIFELAPAVLEYIYGMASPYDSFIAGVSGAGYMNPSIYPQKYLPGFAALTGKEMSGAGVSTLAILDNDVPLLQDYWISKTFAPSLPPFAAEENVKGGILQIGERYQSMKGKILWSNNKPFISARYSFWFSEEGPSQSEIEAFAAELNALEPSVGTEDGYTYVNLHPWSTTYEDLAALLALLDDGIELITADELIYLAANNIAR